MPLTKDQETALSLMLELPPTFTLKGYAGTGKTFLLKHFMEEVSCVITATTHKALSVANGDFTIHSYLGLKLIKEKHRQVLKKAGRNKIKENDVVIIDEASMLNTEVLKFLLEAQEEYSLSLIFVGDPAQIPPVGEDTSPVWDLGGEEFTLTEIMRQAKENPIIQLATDIREFKFSLQNKEKYFSKEISFGTVRDAQNYFIKEWNETGEFPQILAFRNITVDSLNTWARKVVLPGVTEPYVEGEWLYIRSTSEKASFKLEDFVQIKKVGNPYSFKNWLPNPVTAIPLEVEHFLGAQDTIHVPYRPRDERNFQANLSHLSTEARTTNRWKDFWQYMEAMVVVKHIYAMTCHRSQGSTFKKTIVCNYDINSPSLLYTAVTRASDSIFIC